MLKFYQAYATTYHNNIKIGSRKLIGRYLVEENTLKNYTDVLTWGNLEEKYHNNGLTYNFNIWNFKKGRRISFFGGVKLSDKNTWDVKEWKEKELNIKIEYEYEEADKYITINDLRWIDIKKAIQYLNERGLSI